MDINLTPEELDFQLEQRNFFADKFPEDCKKANAENGSISYEQQIRWQKILHENGRMAVNWPVEYGGTGWNSTQKYLYAHEMAAANCPTPIAFGVNMVGPVIYTYGNEEQKKRFLPDILESNVHWCQGYSEPNSGSDLASLQTKAERDGDHYIVNGQKTWTTLAQYADWIFCLVRTSSEGKKQEGISFLLIDMKTPGVEVKPIVMIDGGVEVNSVYLDNVKVPVENRIGEEGKGWTYAKVLLQHERTGIAGVASSKRELGRLKELAGSLVHDGKSLLDDEDFSTEVADLEMELLALEYTDLRVLSTVASGRAPGAESSILKIVGSEIQQKLTDLFVRVSGAYALPYVNDNSPSNVRVGPDFARHAAPTYFNRRKVTIYGGSNEIQKNVIAKAVLAL